MASARTLVLHVDGGSRGNPGPAGAGVVIRDGDEQLCFEAAYFLGQQTNNAAEYHGLIRGLQRAAEASPTELHIRSDSELLVKQLTGEYRVKNPKLHQLFEQVQRLLLKFSRWHIRHVRREKNVRADELANLAMDRRADVIVFDETQGGVLADIPTSDAESPAGEVVDASETPTAEDRSSPAGDQAHPPGRVRVRISRAPAADACPAGGCAGEFTVDAVLPAGLCVYAAHAILPTLLAIRSADPDEFNAIPTLTVSCSHPACGATFQLAPQRPKNGHHAT